MEIDAMTDREVNIIVDVFVLNNYKHLEISGYDEDAGHSYTEYTADHLMMGMQELSLRSQTYPLCEDIYNTFACLDELEIQEVIDGCNK